MVIDFLGEGEVGDGQKIEIELKTDEIEKKVDEKEVMVIEEKEDVVRVNVSGLSLDKIEESWGNVLLAVKPFNHSVEAFLRASRPIKLEGQILTLEVFYPFHKDRLEEVKNRKIVEEGLCKVLGCDLGFNCILGKNKKRPLVIKNNTPVDKISSDLVSDDESGETKKDLYDVAKDIFG